MNFFPAFTLFSALLLVFRTIVVTAEFVKKSWNNCKGVYVASVVSCGPGGRLGEKFGSTGSSSSLVMSSHLSGLLSTFVQGESKAEDDLALVFLCE